MSGATMSNTNTTTTNMDIQCSSHFKLSATSCGTCGIHFDSPDTRRQHSKSQWHVNNLKRRVADLEPLTAAQFAATEGPTAPDSPTTAASEASASSSSSISDAEIDSEPEDEFVPEECLFCNTVSEDFDDNVAHMQKTHGMFIPDQERLIVDLETLVRYLHLVVYGYRECLQCGTQRRTAAAVQQHMIGKNHCRFDINAEDSEYRDFYEKHTEDGVEEEQGGGTKKAISDAIEEGSSIHLPSGKTLAHRSAPGPSRPRKKTAGNASSGLLEAATEVDESNASFQLTAPAASGSKTDSRALTRAQKQETLVETQLARLSVNDRAALAHLPAAEQRSILLTQKKQLAKTEKAARRLQTRLEMKANKTGQGRFKSDVPGPKNG